MDTNTQFEYPRREGPEWLPQEEGQAAEASASQEAGLDAGQQAMQNLALEGDHAGELKSYLSSVEALLLGNERSEGVDSDGRRERSGPIVRQHKSFYWYAVSELTKRSASSPLWDSMISSAIGEVIEIFAELESGKERDRIRKGVAKIENVICKLNDTADSVENGTPTSALPRPNDDDRKLARNLRKFSKFLEGVAKEISFGEQALGKRYQNCANRANVRLPDVLGACKPDHFPAQVVMDVLFEEGEGDPFGNIEVSEMLSATSGSSSVPSSSTTVPESQAGSERDSIRMNGVANAIVKLCNLADHIGNRANSAVPSQTSGDFKEFEQQVREVVEILELAVNVNDISLGE